MFLDVLGMDAKTEVGMSSVRLRLARSDEAGLVGQHNRLHPVPQAKLRKDAPHMGPNCRLGHVELTGDLRVGQAACYELEHLRFAISQDLESLRPAARRATTRELGDQAPGDLRGEQGRRA
jgi:hypothetical protein